jgi:hypothetical protein
MREVLRYGSTVDWDGDRLIRIADRGGRVLVQITWRGDDVDHVLVPPISIDGTPASHPIFGTATKIGLTACTPIDWRTPREIPAVAAPGALPPGAGTMVLDAIAITARRAGVPALRYAGPYPTHALWRSLATCFRTTDGEAGFVAGARDIDFEPAPFERWLQTAGAVPDYVDLRDGVERVRVDGVIYEHGGSPARLVRDGDRWTCEVWFGDERWGRVAELSAEGQMYSGLWVLPRSTSDAIGKRFPPELRAALGELVVDLLPRPLGAMADGVLLAHPIRWADLGARAAAIVDGELAVHVAIWERIAPHGMARLALALAEALAPLVARLAQARLAASV